MPLKKNSFDNNRLYRLLSNPSVYSTELLEQINSLLHEHSNLAGLHHPKEGSYFHIVCRNSRGHEE